ncbi:RNA pyrophosphohydrolase [Paraliobacillus ryukyuensis]|uniref:ADP-ribose pyrophosphatase YjhB (NUDIX family) n=1 Tax=Paraliobacillus ryukyuensis TaxID=200904 RepID=A0A366EFC1_9BACI|nr:NUDIX hydrolase [Paraliobacillus ryukyuensis]RBP00430.1 ADP-ribose pyrophosphatase YjhB (NUDIX family) [Paraliobacillus ryukyuensis]
MDYISYVRSMVGHQPLIMVVSGVVVFNKNGHVLMHLRADNQTWGFPGGYMELGESIEDTARREVYEETGLQLGELSLLSVYSGMGNKKTLANGDQVELVQHWFTCHEYSGELVKQNEESLDANFFSLEALPEKIFASQQKVVNDLKSDWQRPIVR